jgi:ubiquinone/menaquinone biosynthesis C-methylase UbiE
MNKLQDKNFWENAWPRYIDAYLATTASRAGIFIHSQLGSQITNVLEIAAGSSRDSLYLAMNGYQATASDFDAKTINYLKERIGSISGFELQTADAFELPFNDKHFDLVFHNGFFVLFNENEKLISLLKEQERVSRRYILIIVHNKLNEKLLKIFKKKSQSDDLYNIRFFSSHEILEIVQKSGINYKSIRVLKFGSIGRLGIDYVAYNSPLNSVISKSFSEKWVPKLYQLQSWNRTERVALVIELL